jgi:hypothetical protein
MASSVRVNELLQPAVLPSAGVPRPVGADAPGACPGGIFAGQLFGTRTWAGDPGMTFCARHQVEVLLGGLDSLRLEETERDGHASSAPKHWHTFDISPATQSASARRHPASR